MNMENIKKYKGAIILVLVIAVGGFFFVSHNNSKAIADFATSYKNFDKATQDFSVPVLVANLDGSPNLDKFDKIYSQITASLKNTAPNGDRLELAKEAISVNNEIIDYLNNTDTLEGKAGDMLRELNTKASAIKDEELRSKAIEIADLSGKELDNLSAYKRAIWDKRDITNKLLQNVVDDNGGPSGFINFLSQKNNQTKITSQNTDLDRLSKEFGDLINNRTTAYARFQGLAGIKD